jgi:hypothetical protein
MDQSGQSKSYMWRDRDNDCTSKGAMLIIDGLGIDHSAKLSRHTRPFETSKTQSIFGHLVDRASCSILGEPKTTMSTTEAKPPLQVLLFGLGACVSTVFWYRRILNTNMVLQESEASTLSF